MSSWDCSVCCTTNSACEKRCEVCGESESKRLRPASPVSSEDDDAHDDAYDEVADDDDDVLADREKAQEPQTHTIRFTTARVLPTEAIEAWGLKGRMQIKLIFESVEAVCNLEVDRVTLSILDSESVPIDAASNGCIVAQQIEQIVLQHWRSHAVDELDPFGDTERLLMRRLPTLNEHCALCDQPHPFAAMLNPSVCMRALCAHQHKTFGHLITGARDPAVHAEVLDLLVATTTKACKSWRRADIFQPFPLVQDPKDTTRAALNPEKPNYELAEEVMRAFPSFQSVARGDAAAGAAGAATGAGSSLGKRGRAISFMSSLDQAHPLCAGMFEWIVSSNRAHIVSLTKEQRIACIPTVHQFVMLSAPPERQMAFDRLRAVHGTKFAWHGSASENWHAILRTGLKNCSGTKLMTTGAASGAGIYLSTAIGISLGYSHMHSPDASSVGATGNPRKLAGPLPLPSNVHAVAPAKTLRQNQEEALRDKVREVRREYKEAVVMAKQMGLPPPPPPSIPLDDKAAAPAAAAAAASGPASSSRGGGGDREDSDNCFLSSENTLQIIALCEVAQVPSLRKRGNIWVSPEEEAVVTRFLFAFPKGTASGVHASMPSNTTNQDFERSVRECIAKLGKEPKQARAA